jgi:hypothetical protein
MAAGMEFQIGKCQKSVCNVLLCKCIVLSKKKAITSHTHSSISMQVLYSKFHKVMAAGMEFQIREHQ